MYKFKLPKINLHLFEGGAASGGDGGAGGGATASADGNKGDGNTTAHGNTRRGKSGAYDNVVFGKQNGTTVTDAAESTDKSQVAAEDKKSDVVITSNTLDDRRKAFLDLVNGEYKDIYTEETQRIINRRFKETSVLQAQVDKTQPVIDMLMQRYNVKDGDIAKLTSALESDDAYWMEAADEAGMTVEQYKEFQKLKRENEAFLKAQESQKEEQFAQSQAQKWYNEAEAVKTKFPDFDFAEELKNESFIRMLKSGTPVEHAYKVIHFDELMGNAMQTTAASVEKSLVDNIRAKGTRPTENGTASQSAFTVKDDVSKLSKKDRAEIALRVARGEEISF